MRLFRQRSEREKREEPTTTTIEAFCRSVREGKLEQVQHQILATKKERTDEIPEGTTTISRFDDMLHRGLFIAARSNQYEMCRMLLRYGADPLLENSAGENVADVVSPTNSRRLKQFLVDVQQAKVHHGVKRNSVLEMLLHADEDDGGVRRRRSSDSVSTYSTFAGTTRRRGRTPPPLPPFPPPKGLPPGLSCNREIDGRPRTLPPGIIIGVTVRASPPPVPKAAISASPPSLRIPPSMSKEEEEEEDSKVSSSLSSMASGPQSSSPFASSSLLFSEDPDAVLPESIASLGFRKLSTLKRFCKRVRTKKGAVICCAGSSADGLMILTKGQVEIVSSKTKQRLAQLSPIAIFGYFSFVFGIRRLNHVIAAEDVVEYLHLSKTAIDTLNVRWNGQLYRALSGDERSRRVAKDDGVGVGSVASSSFATPSAECFVDKLIWKTRRRTKQLHETFYNVGELAPNAKILKPRRRTILGRNDAELEEDEAVRLHSGEAFSAVPPPPTLRVVRTAEMDELAKTVGAKCNVPYLLAMSRLKNNNKRRSKKKVLAGEFEANRLLKTRNTRAGTSFNEFVSQRHEDILAQIDEVRIAARTSAKGRTLFMAATCGRTKFYVTDKTGARRVPFRMKIQRIDPMGNDTDLGMS